MLALPLLVALLLVPGISGDLYLDALPTPVQDQNRILVTVVISTQARQHLLTKLLHGYVHLCEAGYEVHVILVTAVSWDENDASLYSKDSHYFCMRLKLDIPVVVHKERSYRMSAVHRELFLRLIDKYDYFLSQEDDIMVRPYNVDYFVHWSKRFNGTNYYPGLNLFEFVNKFTNNFSAYSFHPMYSLSLTPNNVREHYIFAYNGTILTMNQRPWAPVYIINKDQLVRFSSQPAWLEDKYKPWNEYNPHFQHMFLARYLSIVVPLEDIDRSYVHHAPNKYVNIMIDESKNKDHNHAVDTRELLAGFDHCLNHSHIVDSSHRWSLTSVKYNNGYGNQRNLCATCLAKGKAAYLNMRFLGKFSFDSSISHSSASMQMRCIPLKNIPNQRVMSCSVNKTICEAGFGDGAYIITDTDAPTAHWPDLIRTYFEIAFNYAKFKFYLWTGYNI